jgi:2-polyprenyl-3-methyl-5-hydroxy-6-metoxy-1,4-benzoquinol methylase
VTALAYDPTTDFDRHYTLAAARRIVRFVRPADRVLEVGCARGLMTARLAARAAHVHAIDVDAEHLAVARGLGLEDVSFERVAIEQLPAGATYDHVVLASVLGEVEDPGAVLAACAARLGPGGMLHVTSNNPESLHRLLALELDLLADPAELSARNAALGVQRLLSANEIAGLGARAGLVELHREALLVKPLTNAQLASFPDDVIAGLDGLARHLPEHGAQTYLVLAPEASR